MSRILLVADANHARERLATAIASAPHTVKVSSPGDLRLENAREWAPDIIVMNLSTESAALALRIGMLRDPELANLPFVAMGDDEGEARALGAHAFVPTWVGTEHLLDLLAHVAEHVSPLPM